MMWGTFILILGLCAVVARADVDLTCPIHCGTCQNSSYCDTCEPGFKGESCQYRCDHCKAGTRCRKSDGQCEDGCSNGYYGSDCTKACNNECTACISWNYACESCITGKYGKHSNINYYKCDMNCPEHCLDKLCDKDTGICLACVDGYTGDKCDSPLAESNVTWLLIGAVIGVAVTFILVSSLVVFIVVRRRYGRCLYTFGRRCVVKKKQAELPLETLSQQAEEAGAASGYENVTQYDTLGDRRETENEYNTITP